MALYKKPESDPGRGVLLMVEQKEEDKERQGSVETEMNKCTHHPCKYTA